jgi:hypothetical protein
VRVISISWAWAGNASKMRAKSIFISLLIPWKLRKKSDRKSH